MPDLKNEIILFIITAISSGVTGILTWLIKGRLDRKKSEIEIETLEQSREQKAIDFREELISKVELLQEHQYQLQNEVSAVTLENMRLKTELQQLKLKNEERDLEIERLTKQIDEYHKENIKLQEENKQLKLNLNKD